MWRDEVIQAALSGTILLAGLRNLRLSSRLYNLNLGFYRIFCADMFVKPEFSAAAVIRVRRAPATLCAPESLVITRALPN
jgi:hypothetical protein